MPKKLETVKLVASLEKAGRHTEKAIWGDLAERLMKKRRVKITVNIDELNALAKQYQGKIMVVPGKVLARGELNEKVSVAAASISQEAKAKILQKGSYMTLAELAAKADKIKKNELVLIG